MTIMDNNYAMDIQQETPCPIISHFPENEMKKKKILSFFLALCLAAVLMPAIPARALTDPDIQSRAAVVMDRTTREVYFSRNADELVYPASTTKIMTVLLAVEAVELGNVALADEVTAGENMLFDLVDDGSTAGITVGETMSLESLLYCAMLSSANEACNIIAEYVAGSVPAFVDRMNQKAAELGCSNTHFANAHGLPDSNHYTTPSDFCRIAMEAASHDLFMRICGTASVDIPATNLSAVRHLVNSNALLTADSHYGSIYYYPDASGIKTGYTNDAGYCLVSTASRDGINLLCAVFGGYADTGEDGVTHYSNFADSITLYDWVFDNFSYQDILHPSENLASVDVSMGKDADYVNLRPAGSISLLLPNDYDPEDFDLEFTVYALQQGETVNAPITAGEVLGEVSVMRSGVSCGTVKLVAASSVELSRTQYILSHVRETTHSSAFRIIAAAAIAILVLYLAWVILYRVKVHRYRRALRAARRQSAAQRSGQRSTAPQRSAPSVEFFPDEPLPQEALSSARPVENKTVYSEPDASSAKRAEKKQPVRAAAAAEHASGQEGQDSARKQSRSAPEGAALQEPLSMLEDDQERDYFEEFFRQK